MRTKEWLDAIIDKGVLCDEYKDKVQKALNKKELMDIVLDANGVSWIPEQIYKKRGLDYDTICEEFGAFINGKYKAEYRDNDGKGYTSSMYVRQTDKIIVDTTLCCLMDVVGKVRISENNVAKIYLDQNCDIEIDVPESSKCIVYYFVGAKIRNFKQLKKHHGVYVWEWKEGD